jgi:prepilin-type processing-associated H-X9-DG protein
MAAAGNRSSHARRPARLFHQRREPQGIHAERTAEPGSGRVLLLAADTSRCDGICHVRSQVTLNQITDGTSNTYLLGEKYLNPDHYYTGLDLGDNQTAFAGVCYDTIRYGRTSSPPAQDRPGLTDPLIFGSAHGGGCQFVFCDGSVHLINYRIDPATHTCLARRNDGVPVNPGKY